MYDKCPICIEQHINKIILNCTHSFCAHCINKWYKTYIGNQEPLSEDNATSKDLNVPCPVCKTPSTDEIWDKVINDFIY